MTSSRRVQDEPAWVLHHRPFRDSSRILDILSRQHGRLSLVARGSRGSKSRLKGILRPFSPLNLSWVMRSDLGTLTGADMIGVPITLSGDALLSGYYVNELLLKLLHNHDPQPDIFDLYGLTIAKLSAASDVTPALRIFEIELLRLLGYALNLHHDTESQEELAGDGLYEYRPEQGPASVVNRQGPMIFTGAEIVAIREMNFDDPAVLRNAARLLRSVIAFHLGGKELKSRKVLMELKRGDIRERTTGMNSE